MFTLKRNGIFVDHVYISSVWSPGCVC